MIRQPDVDGCIEQIREHNIGLFVVDPFVETHEVNENSNEQIKIVAAMFREVARRHQLRRSAGPSHRQAAAGHE